MNVGEMVSRVQRLFGDTSEVQITRADIIGWLNSGQVDVARKTEALKVHSETSAVSSDGSYTLPDDFIKISRVTFDNRLLRHTTFEEIDHYNGDRDVSNPVGAPSKYYTWGRDIYVYPAPSTSGTGNLDVWYIKRPVDLIADADVCELPAFLHEDVLMYALARAKQSDEEFEQAQAISADYETRLIQSKDDIQNQNQSSYPAIRSIPGDDY